MKEEEAALILQCAYRTHLALKTVRRVAREVYVKEIDPESGYPFYFNRVTGASSWDRPKVLGLRDDEDDQAIQTTLQVDDVHYDNDYSRMRM